MKCFGDLWPLERLEGRVVLFERLSLGGLGSASSGRNDDRARLLLEGFSVDDFLGLMYVMGWSESGEGEGRKGRGKR